MSILSSDVFFLFRVGNKMAMLIKCSRV